MPISLMISRPGRAAYRPEILGVPCRNRQASSRRTISGANANGRSWAIQPVSFGSQPTADIRIDPDERVARTAA